MTPGCERAIAIRSATRARSASTRSFGYDAAVSSSASTPSTGASPSGSSVVENSSRSGSAETDSSAPCPCSSWAISVWSCDAVPSRTAPDSTDVRAVWVAAARALAAAKGTRSRSSTSGTPSRGTTTFSPVGSTVSVTAGAGWGRGSPSGGISDRSSAGAVIRGPRGVVSEAIDVGGCSSGTPGRAQLQHRRGARIQSPGGDLHLLGGDGGQPGGVLTGQLGAAVDQLGGGEGERAA